MTFATPVECPDDAQDSPSSHDKAVDLLLQDREMVSRLLREHQMLYEAFQHSPMVSAIHGPDGRLAAWNMLYDRLHADEIEFDIAACPQIGGEPQERDYGDGQIYRVYCYRLPNGSIAQAAVPIATEKARERELERAKEEAEAASRAKADFLASMSHEIRTPMNGLLGMANLLAESGLSKGQQMYADVVLRSGEALLAITNDILDLSKIEAGRVELDNVSFDITHCIEETATLFAANADEKGLDLIVRIDPVLPRRLIGDQNRLRQVVANLLGNAIKFTDTGHILLDLDAKMQTREDGRRIARLTCRVQDTGVGIPSGQCETIFGRFRQADNAETRTQQGTGLGLAVVESLVGKMGGTVGVDSIEGEGTTFHFTIDLPVDASEAMLAANETVRGKRVLIVDAESARRTIMAEKIKAWDFQVAPCGGVREGLAFMDAMESRGLGVDLVLLGENIAEGKAPLFTRALSERAGANPPVILMARLGSLSICDEDEKAGIVLAGTLARPVKTAQLLECMEKALLAPPHRPESADIGPVADAKAETFAEPEACDDLPIASAAEDTEPGTEETALAAEDEGHEPLPADSPAPSEEAVAPLDILVAEDNEVNQFLIEEILRDSGHTYRIVDDGKKALETWREEKPRLILMDVSMPVMSGDEATMQIRAEEEGKGRTPIVAVTAHALRGDRERCIQAGMDDHLTKPVTVGSIMKIVDHYLHPGAEAATG